MLQSKYTYNTITKVKNILEIYQFVNNTTDIFQISFRIPRSFYKIKRFRQLIDGIKDHIQDSEN